MMMMSAHGRLARDPQPITTKTGTAMAKATIAVSLDLRENNETVDGTLWVLVTAFGKLAEILERQKQGEMINVAGNCQLSKYTTNEGEVRENVTVIIDSLISARTTRPGGGKRKSEQPDNGPQSYVEQPPYSDEQARYTSV